MNHMDIVRQAEENGVKLVTFYYCDNGGIIRGKTTHVSKLGSRLSSGMGLTVAMQAMSDMDDLLLVDGMGPVGEVRLIPDADTFTVLPYAPGRAFMLSDLVETSGRAWDACPRSFLKGVLDKAASMGLSIQASFEPEWYLMSRGDDGRFVPCDESLDNASIGEMFARVVVDDVVSALELQGLEIEQYYPELGHGQQELSISHADALGAADNHIIYRETVRNVAFNHGMYASFAPKPFPDQAGSGCHMHLSAWDRSGESNLLYDAGDDHGLSVLAYHFIAGIMDHLSGLLALTCPSMNSYRRLSPGSWSTAYACYGPDNREAALRIPSRFWGSEMASTNLEFRPADSSCNPYIALGGLIAAGLDGVERELMPNEGQWLDVDPSRLSADELDKRGIYRYPESLDDAVRALESDTVLMDVMGSKLSESYLAIRRADWELFSEHDVDYEVKHHIYKY